MQSLDPSPSGEFPILSQLTTEDALIQAFLHRVPVEHRAKVHERLLREDKLVFAQSSDREGQAILDRLHKLRRSE